MNITTEKFRLLFHESYWCISAFSSLKAEDIEKQAGEMDKYIQTHLEACESSKLSPKFVPSEEKRKHIALIAQSLDVSVSWTTILPNFHYEKKGQLYDQVGYFLLRVKLKDAEKLKVEVASIRPGDLQQIVFYVWYDFAKKYKANFIFDETAPPYLVTVCSGYIPADPHVIWTDENRMGHKEELGQWVEIYSGQFPDYKSNLYERRVAVDLSNRTSELHLINKNSALLYMDRDNYTKFFIKDDTMPKSTGYMYNTVIRTIVRIRIISFTLLMVSQDIDEDTGNLAKEEYMERDPDEIKTDLEKTNRLKNALNGLLSPYFSDLIRSHRQHYTAVLKHLIDLYDIDTNWERILKKIEMNTDQLNSVYLDKQAEASEQQEKVLNVVNVLLGAGILFEIVDYVVLDDIGDYELIRKLAKVGISGVMLVILLVMVLKLRKQGKDDKKKKK